MAETIFTEEKGSWTFKIEIEPAIGAVVASGARSGRKAVALYVYPVEATGMGAFSRFATSSLVQILGGKKAKNAFQNAYDKVLKTFGK